MTINLSLTIYSIHYPDAPVTSAPSLCKHFLRYCTVCFLHVNHCLNMCYVINKRSQPSAPKAATINKIKQNCTGMHNLFSIFSLICWWIQALLNIILHWGHVNIHFKAVWKCTNNSWLSQTFSGKKAYTVGCQLRSNLYRTTFLVWLAVRWHLHLGVGFGPFSRIEHGLWQIKVKSK